MSLLEYLLTGHRKVGLSSNLLVEHKFLGGKLGTIEESKSHMYGDGQHITSEVLLSLHFYL